MSKVCKESGNNADEAESGGPGTSLFDMMSDDEYNTVFHARP